MSILAPWLSAAEATDLIGGGEDTIRKLAKDHPELIVPRLSIKSPLRFRTFALLKFLGFSDEAAAERIRTAVEYHPPKPKKPRKAEASDEADTDVAS